LLGSLRISKQTMTTGGRAVPMQQARNDEVIGKIFVALSQDMRQCLICDGVFTKQGSADHSATPCYPRTRESEQDKRYGPAAETCSPDGFAGARTIRATPITTRTADPISSPRATRFRNA